MQNIIHANTLFLPHQTRCRWTN